MQYEIMQLKRDNPNLFACWEEVKNEFDLTDYKKVYVGEIELNENPEYTLEDLFMIFNTKHPKDFKGHSLSVSDVVKLDDEYYYCDSFGWVKIK